MSDEPGKKATPRRAWLILGAVVVVLVVLVALGGGVAQRLGDLIRAAAAGARGPAARLAIYSLASGFTFLTVFLPLPAEAAAFLNGSLFPPTVAFFLTWTWAMAGAGASYEIGRRLGRGPAARIFGEGSMGRVERLIDRAGWPTLLALRLSPVMAFTAINWASGILALSRPVFYWTTAVGLIPGTYVFTMVPQLLESGASTARLAALATAVAIGLLSVSYLRIRKTR